MSWTEIETHLTSRLLVCSWTSDGSGNVSDSTSTTIAPITGYMTSAIFVPGGTTPTDLYDFEINATMNGGTFAAHRNGADLPAASSVSRDCVNATGISDWIPLVNATLTAVGSNCGAAKTGTILVTIQSLPR